jgi:hypothetical protein
MPTDENLRYSTAKRGTEDSDLANPFGIQHRVQPVSKLLDGRSVRIRWVHRAIIFAHSQRELETEVIHQLAPGNEQNSSYTCAEDTVSPFPAALLRYGPEAIESGLLVHVWPTQSNRDFSQGSI